MSEESKAVDRPWLQTLERACGVLRSLVEGAEPDALAWKPSADRWSITDVLAHLLDVEVNALGLRARRIVNEDHPLLENYDQMAGAARPSYRALKPAELLNRFAEERQKNLDWLGRLPPEALERSGRHQEIGEITLRNHVNQWAFHDLGHIRQIAELYRAYTYYPHTGNYHKYYSVSP